MGPFCLQRLVSRSIDYGRSGPAWKEAVRKDNMQASGDLTRPGVGHMQCNLICEIFVKEFAGSSYF